MKETELRWYGKVLSPELDEVRIVVISDLHYGNPYCSIKHFQRTLQFIFENENCYCFLNGDMCESTIKTSKGDIFREVGTPQDQRDWVIEQMLPIKDKVLGVTTGNHENRIYNETGIDISQDIAQALGVPYRADGMLFKLSFGNGKGVRSHHEDRQFVFWSYITHGYGGARTKSAKAVKVERLSSWIHADWYAMSHDHVVNIAPDIYLIPDPRATPHELEGFVHGKVSAHREMLVKTSAYLKWGGYSEMFGFPPSDLATPVIMLLTPKSKSWDILPEKKHQAVKVIV